MSPIFSPTLTASSSSSRGFAFDKMPDLDLPADHEGGIPDFSELLNFDDLDSGMSSHSPTTISPNHTPSPLPQSHSPFAMQPTYDSFDQVRDFSFDFPIEKSVAGPSQVFNFDDTAFVNPEFVAEPIVVKQEPIEYGWSEQRVDPYPASVQPAQPDLTATISALPAEQQLALQQLVANLLNFPAQAAVNLSGGNHDNQVSAPVQQTIEPSLLFGNSPGISNMSSASSGFASYVSPASSSQFQAYSQPQSQSQSPIVQYKRPNTDLALDDIAEEPLQSVSPDEQPAKRVRADSVFSLGGDIDAKLDQLVPLPDIFSAGKGKGGKKGGGLSSVVKMDDEDLDEDDSWRPSPEEYKKLSSKEKRQLRNKLSARAFRTRRKDYIGTLEGHIKDRDTVIDAIKSELVNSRSENQDLRKELAALKQSTMSVLHPESANKPSQSPALISALAMSPALPPLASGSAPARKTATPTPMFNPRKDLPASSSLYGGNDNILGGGSTICHTLFTPDVVLPPSPTTPFRAIDLPRQNLNPLLDDVDARGTHLASAANGRDIASSSFQDWSENNAFSLRSMDSYRMQMWSRLAREAQAEKAGLAAEVRPKFFVEQKDAAQAREAAQLAGLATSHITSRLASSFWSAFTSPGVGAGVKELDTDKLTAVVTGRSRVKVVDAVEDDLAAALGGLKLQSGSGFGGGTRIGIGMGSFGRLGVRENPLGAISSFLGLVSVMPASA